MKKNIYNICFILLYLIQFSIQQNENFQLLTPKNELDLYEGGLNAGCSSPMSFMIIPPNGESIIGYNATSVGVNVNLEVLSSDSKGNKIYDNMLLTFNTGTYTITVFGFFNVTEYKSFSFQYFCSPIPIESVTVIKTNANIKRFYENGNKYAYYVGVRMKGFQKLFSNFIQVSILPNSSVDVNSPEIITDYSNYDLVLNIPIIPIANTFNFFEPVNITIILCEVKFNNIFQPLFLFGQDPPPKQISSTTKGSFSSIFVEYYQKNMTFNSVSYFGIPLQPTDFPVLGNPQSCMRLGRFVQDRVIGNSIQNNVITLQYFNQSLETFSNFVTLDPIELINTLQPPIGCICNAKSVLLSGSLYKYMQITNIYFKSDPIYKIPYGLQRGDLKTSDFKPEVMVSKYFPSFSLYVNNILSGLCEYPGYIVDSNPPDILKLEVRRVSQKSSKWNVRLAYSDAISGIAFAYYKGIGPTNIIIADASNIHQGNINSGILEFQLDSSKQEITALNSFTLMDNASKKSQFIQKPRSQAFYLTDNFVNLGNFTYFKFQYQKVVFNEAVTASNVPKPFKNTLYFNLTYRNDEVPLSLSFPTQLFEEQTSYFPSFWDDSFNLYRIDFEIPYNFFTQELNYQIMNPTSYDKNIITYDSLVAYFGDIAILKIEATSADQLPPLISFIEPLVFVNGGDVLVQFNFKISEQINGLAGGIIKILGDNDPIGFETKIQGITNPLLHEFSVTKSFNSSACKNQNYYVSYVELYDLMGRRGVYDTLATRDQGIHPMYKILQNNNIATVTQCSGTDSLSPYIYPNSFSIVNNENSTQTIIKFKIEDLESGLNSNVYPICYLSTTFERRISVVSTCDMSGSGYFQQSSCQCSFEIPFMFGYPEGMLLEIYGIYDNAINFRGYEHYTLFTTEIIPPKSINIPYISNIEPYYKNQLTLTLAGVNFLSKSILLFDSNNVNISIIKEYLQITNNNIIVSLEIPIVEPFQVIVLLDTYQSNKVKVTPLDIEAPTTPPGKCLNDCGTSDQGTCTNNGCICYKPWIGDDCRSKVINTTTPQTNTTSPSTGQEYEEELPTGEKVNLSTLISVVGLRELDINGNTIRQERFSEWVYTNISTNNLTKYHYSTQIITPLGEGLPDYITRIQVTTQWFDSLESITFAGETFNINPSTMKYSISISSYKFKSQLSKLQLIFSASIQSNNNDNDEICSSKQFKESDNTEIESEYIKLSLNTHSLFGRFIKRAIVDDRITIIDNQLVNQSESDLVPEKSESLIAINIPNFDTLVLLDPDFSLLVNPSSNKDDDDSLCSSESKGLSKSQLAGIIIGSVGGFLIIAIVAGLLIHRKAKYSEWFLQIKDKMNKRNEIKMERRKRSIAPVFFGGKVQEVDKF